MARKYIVKATKYGRDWKKIGEGIDFLEDNKLYRLEFHADGLIQAIRAKKRLNKIKDLNISLIERGIQRYCWVSFFYISRKIHALL